MSTSTAGIWIICAVGVIGLIAAVVIVRLAGRRPHHANPQRGQMRGPASSWACEAGRALALQPGQALARGAQAAGCGGEAGPGVLAAVDPGAYRRHRELGRI